MVSRFSFAHTAHTPHFFVFFQVGHPGLNNKYQIDQQTDLAILYNDKSVLENHHLATAFFCAKKKECNVFLGLDRERFNRCRRLMIEAVLATDLSDHLAFIGSANAQLATGQDISAVMAFQIALKAADVGHSCKPLSVHVKW